MILTSLVIIPFIFAFVLLLTPNKWSKYVALSGSLIVLGVCIAILNEFDINSGNYQFAEKFVIDGNSFFAWNLAVDGISLFLVLLTAVIFPIVIFAVDAHHDDKSYYFLILMLLAGSMGAFLSADLLLFFVFFEIVLIPMYFLIGSWGHENSKYAAMKFFLFTLAGSALMLVGIISLFALTGSGFDVEELRYSVIDLSDTAALLIFLSFALAFAVKIPTFPLHTWLPDAHTEAPTGGSIILAAVMLKLGTYGFVRFCLYLFPEQSKQYAPVFLTLAVIGIIYGAAVATMQKDLKRLVAYSSIAHMGFVLLGIFALTLNSLQGSILQMVNHGVSTGALFMIVGWIYERRHTREISKLSGLARSAPKMAAVMIFVIFSSIGLPGLNGFIGEYLILLGSFNSARWWTVVAVSGVIFAALYMLWAYQRTFQGPSDGENAEMKDISVKEFLAISPLLALILFFGLFPNFALKRIEPSLDRLIEVSKFSDESAALESEPTDVDDISNYLESKDDSHGGK